MKRPQQIAQIFSGTKILIAVMLGLLVSMYLIFRDFDISKYQNLHWGYQSVFYFTIALGMMFLRDLAYMYRLIVLTQNKLQWKHSFQVIMLWEFASALTPSVVGGSAAAFYFVSKETHNVGKSTAIVMITAMLDEMFYIVMVPIIILIVGWDRLMISGDLNVVFGVQWSTSYVFIAGYLFILLLTSIIAFAIFLKPVWFKHLLIQIFSWSILRKWQVKMEKIGDEIIITSEEFRGKTIFFWAKAFGATLVSWTARFWVVNFLILAFINSADHLLIFARQLMMWVILLISPTPGGSGVAEFMLPKFLGHSLGSFGDEIALVWRLFSYYLYLIIGAIVLPVWLRRVYKHKPSSDQDIPKTDSI